MKILSIILTITGLILTLFGCSQNILTSQTNSSIGNEFDNDEEIKLFFSSSLPTITLENSQAYPISGVCDSAAGVVAVVVGTPNVTKNFPCDLNGNFSGTIDVSKVTLNPTNIVATQGGAIASSDLMPINDQNGPISAPVATSPGTYIGGVSFYNLSILCNEEGEIVSISGAGIDPGTQTYTCTDSGAEDFPLVLASSTETNNPNELTVSSTDKYNNPSEATTTVNVPIDNVIPVVSVTAGLGVIQGQRASFSVAVTDLNISTLSYTVNTSGVESLSYNCNTNPCLITTGVIQSPGELTLTVGAKSVADDLGNTGDSVLRSDSLTVSPAGALGFNNPLSTINTQNASSYPVEGVCDGALGNVTITVGGVSESISCNAPGVFSGNIDLTSVNLNPAELNVVQGVKTVPASPFPVNDQTPILNAPTIADENYKSGLSTTLALNCNEAGEVVTFTNASLNPTEQMYTCAGSGSENVTLTFSPGEETSDPNSVDVSSVDVNGNPTTNNTQFSLPIDNLGPRAVVTAGLGVIQGQTASFSVAVTDLNISTLSYTVNTSGVESLSYNCNTNPCLITTGVIQSPGELILTVGANSVADDLGNTGDSVLRSDSLTVSPAGALGFNNPLSTINTQNASSYPVAGVCDGALGNVTITVGGVSESISCNAPGVFSGNIDLTSVNLNPAELNVAQGAQTVPASPFPVNDQTPILNAPTIADENYKSGLSTTLALNCNEAGEVVTFTNASLNPTEQMYTCAGSGSENVTLTFSPGEETSDPNNVDVSSVDVNGNPTTNNTQFSLPIDNLGPRVSVTAGLGVIQGQTASFSVAVTDLNISTLSYTVNTSGVESLSYNCNTNPCLITTGVIQSPGELTLTVGANSVGDDLGNMGDSVVRSDSLTVSPAGALGFNNPLSTINTQNASSYPVEGVCDGALGNVTITVGGVSESISCNAPGVFSSNIDLTSVNLNPAELNVAQGAQTVPASPFPVNDQTPIDTAPTIGDQNYKSGLSTTLALNCNEAGEVVTFTNASLNPTEQTYTCLNSGSENVTLTFAPGEETSDPNSVDVSSVDVNGNPTTNNTQFSLPIDNLGPRAVVTAGLGVIQGQTASFSVAVTDLNISTLSYTVNTSGVESLSYNCNTNPCLITTGVIQSPGELILTVGAKSVGDDLGNMGDSVVRSDSLTVSPAGALGFNNPLSTINTQNASSYPVEGVCDGALGSVTVTVGGVSESISCNAPGVFSGNIDLTSVNLNPAELNVAQGAQTVPASPFPVNDQTPIDTAPTIGDQNYKSGLSTTLALNCNEAGEVVTFTNAFLNPTEQTYTCLNSGSENVTLTFSPGEETSDPNSVDVSSVDVNGNPTTNNTQFSLPIDNLGPRVSVTAGLGVIQGQTASFSVAVTDLNISTLSYTVNTSGVESLSYNCNTNPCLITTGVIQSPGELTLTVGANSVGDDLGNMGDSVVRSDSLTVSPAGALGFNNPLSTINTQNASSYPVEGVCDGALGNVTITVGGVSESISCNAPGVFSSNIDLTSVNLNPAELNVAQGAQTVPASPFPVNDQTPIDTAPTIGDQNYKSGLSTTLALNCNEAGEVVTFTNAFLNPTEQTYTCLNSGSENVTLTFSPGEEISDPNSVDVSSVDINGNPTINNTQFSLPIDNLGPRVSVTAGLGVIQGQTASFSVAVTDLNISTLSYTVNTSGVESLSYNCNTNPCLITTGVIQSPGELTLTVGAKSVGDDLGNMGDSVVRSDSLTVSPAGALGFNNPLSTINTQNASSYPVEGVCDGALGNVTITVGGVSESISCNAPGVFSSNIDLTSVNLNPAELNVAQGAQTVPASPFPVNDQTPILNAPTIADQNYKSGLSTTLALNCNEAGEVVTFTNASLNPTEQTYTCLNSGSENVTLTFAPGEETSDPNNVDVSSVDINGNPTINNTQFSLPIDNVAPTVSVIAGASIVEGSSASFTVTVSDGNSFIPFTPIVSSGTVSFGACSQALCQVTVTGAVAGTLTLTVDAGDVVDAAGNANAALVSDNLIVSAPQILGAIVSSSDGDSDAWYEDLDTVSIQVQYDANVVVNTSSGTPTIQVTLSSGIKTAIYSQGSGSQNLDFTIPVVNNDYQCNGILALGGVDLNGGTIQGSLGGTVNNSGLPPSVSGAKIDAKNPTAPSGLSNDPTNAFNNFSSALSWTQGTDECGLSNVEYGFGTSLGGLDTQSYIDIGLVATYQAQSGKDLALFNLMANANYYTSIRSVDDAGNVSQEESSLAWSFMCSDPWTGISRLVALDSSNEESIFDINNVDASDASFDGFVHRWEDQSGSNNHLEAPSLGARPIYNHDGLSSGLDSYVQGDGEDDTLVNDIDDVTSSFQFYYVLKSLDPAPSSRASYFSNSDNHLLAGSFQLDYDETGDCAGKFRIFIRDLEGAPVVSICGSDYNTNQHVFIIKYNDSTKIMSLSVDGIETGSYTFTNSPAFRWLRLFQNRAGHQFQQAQALELNLATQNLTSTQEEAISEYLVCKWNVIL